MWKTTPASLIRLLRLFLLIGIAAVHASCISGVDSGRLPAIVLQPQLGAPGTVVVVTGSGFPTRTAVAIRLGPPDVGASPLAYAAATADAEGAFTTTFTLPGQWPDGHPIDEGQLLVIALNEDGSIKATAPFAFLPGITPTLALDPEEGAPGQRVQVRGADFSPGQPLTLRLVAPAIAAAARSQELAAVLGGDDGSFLTTITIPAEWFAGEPVSEQLLFIEALDGSIQPLVRARFFNRAGEDAGPFFYPPAPPLCAEMQSTLTLLLAAPVVRSEGAVAFEDPLTGLIGESCRLTGEAAGERFAGQDDAMTALRSLFQEGGWQEAERYAQLEPGRARFAMERGDLLALVQLERRPTADGSCTSGQSSADCADSLARSQIRYAVVIELVEADGN